jgi:hypothetical protein
MPKKTPTTKKTAAPKPTTKKADGRTVTKKKAPAPAARKTTTKTETEDKAPSNKAVVWTAWEKAGRELDPDKALDLVEGRVKRQTIVGWMSAWARGQNLPGCAK